MPTELPPPVVLALIAADEITFDPDNGKPSAHGLFFEIAHPARVSFDVLVLVTEVRHAVKLAVELLDPDDAPVHGSVWPVAGGDPLRVHGLVAKCRDVLFERPGTYFVRVSVAGTPIGEQRITVGGG